MRFSILLIGCVALVLCLHMGIVPADASNRKVVDRALDNYERSHAEALSSVSSSGREMTSAQDVSKAAPKGGRQFTFNMGLEYYLYKYKETVQGRGFMDYQGHFKGIFASMVYRPLTLDSYWSEFMDHLVLDARLAWADLNYHGGMADMDGNFLGGFNMNDVPQVVTELRALAAKDFVYSIATFTPYLGLGYRFLKDDPTKTKSTFTFEGTDYLVDGSYKRISQYYYLPIGLDVTKDFPNKWKIGLNTEFDYLIYGTQRSYISSPLGTPTINPQWHGYGLRASMRLARDYEKYGLTFEPFIRYWNIEDSDFTPVEDCLPGELCHGILEPSNTTREIGAKIGMTF